MAKHVAFSGDNLASFSRSGTPLVGVTVQAYATESATYVAVKQFGPGLPGGGREVELVAFPRSTTKEVDVMVLAAWLARTVSAFDREGWEMLS